MTTTEVAGLQEEAREFYRQSMAAEMPVTGKVLGARFDRGERWGRAEREAAGLRTECWMHHRETHGLVGEYVFYPGKGVEKAV